MIGEVAANKSKLSDINPPTVVVMSNSAKDTREGVMDALGNVAGNMAKGAEEFAKEVVTEVRLSRHPQHARPFFDRFRLFLASKKLLQASSTKVKRRCQRQNGKGKKQKPLRLEIPSSSLGIWPFCI